MQFRQTAWGRGSVLVEVAVALAILSVLMVVVAQALIGLSNQQRTLRQRQLAATEVANLMERIIARPWDELTPEQLADHRLPESVVDLLPAAQLAISVTPTELPPYAKRVRVELGWSNSAGQRAAAVRLVAWKYRLRESE